MKKRLSKLALLAIAAAFIVAGFPACSDEEEPDPPAQATATFTGEDIPEAGLALTAGESQDVTATLIVANTAFSDAVKALDAEAGISEYITLIKDDKVSISDVKVAKKADDTTMNIIFTVTAEDGAENGTITATLKAAALTAAKDVAATGAISYTVKAADPDAPKATFAGENIPETGVSLAVGEEKTGDATITVTNTTFSDALKALNEGDAIPDTLLTLNAGGKVTVTSVKVAAKANDTTVKITLAVTAGESTGTGAIKATLKAAAVTAEKDVPATGAIAYTVKDDSKPDETVYFTSFVASELGDVAISNNNDLTSADSLVKTAVKAEYQINQLYTTNDYDEEANIGYSYTARVRIGKNGTLTITHVKPNSVIRFDGGSVTATSTRKMEITGAAETEWVSNVYGSFYLTATAEAVVLKSVTDNFAIYGIHVVDKKVEKSVVKEETAYVAPTLTLSATSVVKDEEVTVTATIPDATKTTTYSTGKVESETVPVDAVISYDGATVTDSKVDTSAEGTLTITASYTIGEATYTSEAVTLEVTGAFTEQEEEVANNNSTLGLTATTVESDNAAVATAKIDGDNIVITSKGKGTANITASDGAKKATIVVTVSANGKIVATPKPYSPATEDSWTITSDLYSKIQTPPEGTTDTAGNFVVKGASEVLTATFYKSGANGHDKTTTSNKVSYGGYGSWAAAPDISGGKLKNDFLKIADIKGSVTLTVEWAMNSKQSKDNRYLEVTVGEDKTKCVQTGCNDAKGKQPAYTVTFDAGTGTNVYIGASNEICLVSVTIKAQ